MTAPFSKVVDEIIYRCFAQGQYWGTEIDGKLDPDYKPENPIDRTEANKALIAAHEADLREALEKLVAPHYDDWHQAYDYNRIAESVLAQLSPDKKEDV